MPLRLTQRVQGYRVDFHGDTHGAYRAAAQVNGKPITNKPMGIFVEPFSRETSPRPANFEVLQDFSYASGASYFKAQEALNSAMMSFTLKAKEESISEFQILWRNWPAVVIALHFFHGHLAPRRTRPIPKNKVFTLWGCLKKPLC